MTERPSRLSLARLVAAVITAATFSLATPVFAQQAVVVGVDLTMENLDSASVRSGVRAYIDRRAEEGVLDGGSIIAVAITSRTLTQPIVLAQKSVPAYPGIKQKARKRALSEFIDELSNRLQQPVSQTALLQESHISEFFIFADNFFQSHGTPLKSRQICLISDMLQVDGWRNFERDKGIDTKGMALPRIGGQIAILGVSSSKYRNAEQWNKVRDLWLNLLGQAGIKVEVYSSTLF